MSKKPQEESIDTLAATAGSGAPTVDSMVPPVYQASVFSIENLEDTDDLFEGRKPGYFYSRDGNPTTDAFAQAVALLEGAEAGAACSSGMGATLVALLAVAEPGTRLVAARDLYGKATALLRTVFSPLGIDVEFVGGQDVGAWEQALSRPASVVFLETETNPLLRVPDLPRIAGAARRCGATVVVDNTFASPYHIRPLELGADLVVHSATKFLSGHGDVTAGVVVGDGKRIASVKSKVSLIGVNLAPFEAWLALRGLKTLAVRLVRSSASASAIAEYLAGHPNVLSVNYPGLETHPDHPIAARVMRNGFGSMISFEVAGGFQGASRLFKGFQRIKYAPSLGDVATTVTHPAKTSHRAISARERSEQGITDGLVRLSVGIEGVDDIAADLERGLSAI